MSAPPRIVLASHNAGKLKELQALFRPLRTELVLLPGLTGHAPEETGSTFIENALIKARHAAQLTKLPALADDSGICVDCLSGAPGVHSARFAGAAANDGDNNRLLLQRLHGVPAEQRGAAFHCVLVFLRSVDDPAPLIASGVWRGVLLDAPQGSAGFGYDPLFFVPTQGQTSAQLPANIKNALSHRGCAARAMLALLTREFHAQAVDANVSSPPTFAVRSGVEPAC